MITVKDAKVNVLLNCSFLVFANKNKPATTTSSDTEIPQIIPIVLVVFLLREICYYFTGVVRLKFILGQRYTLIQYYGKIFFKYKVSLSLYDTLIKHHP